MIKQALLFALLVVSSVSQAQLKCKTSQLELDSIFKGQKGTFVLYDVQNDQYKVYNEERASQKFSVHSTSKILWSIIGLEEGVIANESAVTKWDSTKYARKESWPQGWWQDQTVVTAIYHSVNWYYFELFNQMTPEMVEGYLNEMNYQKGFHIEKLHYYGLTFQIEKSTWEQITFLRDIYNNRYNLNASTIDAVKKGMLQEQMDDYALYYKTGGGPIKNENVIGWVIGFVENSNDLYYFAMNVEDAEFEDIRDRRIEIIHDALKTLELK